MLYNFLNPIKQATAGLSDPRHRTDSQLVLAWESPSPAQVAAISDCFIAQAGWSQAKHRWGLTLACTTQETQGPGHLVDSYIPCWSTTTLPLHS